MSSLTIFQTQIEQLPRREPVTLQIERDGHFQFGAFEID